MGINYELMNFCEIDEETSKAYSLMHNVDKNKNLGDITKVDIDALGYEIDLLTHGSPCQDYSILGKQQGGDANSNTRSSLMWNTVEVIRRKKPKYVIWENVKNVVTKTHRHNFDRYIEVLSEIGYTNYYKVLNAKDYGIPQNRERIFVISVLDGEFPFEFPESFPLVLSPKDFLENGYQFEEHVDKENRIDPKIKRGCRIEFANHYEQIITSEKEIYDCRAKTDFQDKKVGVKISPCLKANNSNVHVLNGKRIQRLTPKEQWRLMGFSDEDYEKAKSTGCSRGKLYKMAGNSIVVDVLIYIFGRLLLKSTNFEITKPFIFKGFREPKSA